MTLPCLFDSRLNQLMPTTGSAIMHGTVVFVFDDDSLGF
jgi:hypothetical protein